MCVYRYAANQSQYVILSTFHELAMIVIPLPALLHTNLCTACHILERSGLRSIRDAPRVPLACNNVHAMFCTGLAREVNLASRHCQAMQ